ncbi:hypothetical protein GCM10027578_33860 [Spirosoma luteolum]
MTTRTALLTAINGLLFSLLSLSTAHSQTTAYYEEKTFALGMYPAAAPGKLWLHVEKDNRTRPVQITLLDARKQSLLNTWIPKRMTSSRQCFDLSQMSDGLYTFVITDGRQTQERRFRLKTTSVEEQLPLRQITLR